MISLYLIALFFSLIGCLFTTQQVFCMESDFLLPPAKYEDGKFIGHLDGTIIFEKDHHKPKRRKSKKKTHRGTSINQGNPQKKEEMTKTKMRIERIIPELFDNSHEIKRTKAKPHHKLKRKDENPKTKIRVKRINGEPQVVLVHKDNSLELKRMNAEPQVVLVREDNSHGLKRMNAEPHHKLKRKDVNPKTKIRVTRMNAEPQVVLVKEDNSHELKRMNAEPRALRIFEDDSRELEDHNPFSH